MAETAALRAAVCIRYHSGDGFGHVGWAFDAPEFVDAGSVENHSGHFFTPAREMGFWNACSTDPIAEMLQRGYDDLKWMDVPEPDPVRAYRTVLWIEREAYKVLHRNCEDDAYDVLRAYGVEDLALPTLIWFPKSWFRRLRGTLRHLRGLEWPLQTPAPGQAHGQERYAALTPWQPTWRRPWHPDFHALKFRRLGLLFRRQ